MSNGNILEKVTARNLDQVPINGTEQHFIYFPYQSCISHLTLSEHLLMTFDCGHWGSLVGCDTFKNFGLNQDH